MISKIKGSRVIKKITIFTVKNKKIVRHISKKNQNVSLESKCFFLIRRNYKDWDGEKSRIESYI